MNKRTEYTVVIDEDELDSIKKGLQYLWMNANQLGWGGYSIESLYELAEKFGVDDEFRKKLKAKYPVLPRTDKSDMMDTMDDGEPQAGKLSVIEAIEGSKNK